MSSSAFMREALRLARRGYGQTSPNPMVGAVLVKNGKIIGRGWHHRAGQPHAEIEALRDADPRGSKVRGATLFVTLEPCSTHGRTPPCTSAIIAAGIKTVVVGATDPNPDHCGEGFAILKRAGIKVISGVLAEECAELNAAFNHWIVHRTPLVTVKAAMTLDGKIATASGESKWITGELARAQGMKLRQGSDAILVGVNTILADDPGLTVRISKKGNNEHRTSNAELRTETARGLRRIVLDSQARTPLTARVLNDEFADLTTVVISDQAPARRITALEKRANILISPTPSHAPRITQNVRVDLHWLLKKLGREKVTSLLVEGGGEVNAAFLLGGFAHRIAFFYAPKILGGRDSRKAVAGEGAANLTDILQLEKLRWKKLGADLLLTAEIAR
jgi:diaminohydroxyphosphoribosylaminopyrimidine deaminase/5-amino-6-(5-phosphoribosylamino)uracil reductase